jgi:hypothetical protein
MASLLLAVALGACSDENRNGRDAADELAAFIARAQRGDCADDVNRIYRIDGNLVLWHREDRRCADAAFGVTLYGASPDDELCTYAQTIGGPRTDCSDDGVRAQFNTIVANLDAPDFGLGERHTVQLVWEAD